MFRNYLGFATLGFCLRCRLLVFFFFFGMVWFRVWVLQVWVFGFCVMTWFNGMVEFWKILFNGQMVVLGNCDRTNACLPTYPLCKRIRSSRNSLIFICLNLPRPPFLVFNLAGPLTFFFTLLLHRSSFRVFNQPFCVCACVCVCVFSLGREIT